jgi:hypothetical protein
MQLQAVDFADMYRLDTMMVGVGGIFLAFPRWQHKTQLYSGLFG